jgi:transcriptional regulator with GAF, ATPase, and Fis domain
VHLLVPDGSGGLRAVPCGGEAVRIGSAPDNDVRLSDRSVSRHHALLEPGPSGLLLRDLGSTNGTFVDGVRVKEAYVEPGRVVRFGTLATELRLQACAEPDARAQPARFGSLVGRSPRMQRLFDLLERVAPTEATLLVCGPTGSGKEALARSVHDASRRRGRPFVVLDCAAADPGLIASDVYGHESGAFTGATGRRAGIFEQAAGGTVFIDELGELPLDMQPKLLRVLDGREVRRLGGTGAVPVDVRLIAATHRDLESMVGRGEFREDLYFRLCQVRIALPGLDERRGDIALLVESLLARHGLPPGALSASALALLEARPFPGNVRQLRSVIDRAVMVRRTDVIQLEELTLFEDAGAARSSVQAPAPAQQPPQQPAPTGPDPRVRERERILAAFTASGYVLARTARDLGMAVNTLKARMRELGIAKVRPYQRRPR